VLVGRPDGAWASLGVLAIEDAGDFEQLRRTIGQAIEGLRPS
jgi:hypothetical protein